MRLFFDTNVLLDVIAQREPFFADSREVLSLGLADSVIGMAADMSFCTIAYVMRNKLQGEVLRSVLRTLQRYVIIVPIGERAVSTAIERFTVDFEDEVQHRAALAAGADVILTRDKDGFANAAIPVMTPTEYLDSLG